MDRYIFLSNKKNLYIGFQYRRLVQVNVHLLFVVGFPMNSFKDVYRVLLVQYLYNGKIVQLNCRFIIK